MMMKRRLAAQMEAINAARLVMKTAEMEPLRYAALQMLTESSLVAALVVFPTGLCGEELVQSFLLMAIEATSDQV